MADSDDDADEPDDETYTVTLDGIGPEEYLMLYAAVEGQHISMHQYGGQHDIDVIHNVMEAISDGTPDGLADDSMEYLENYVNDHLDGAFSVGVPPGGEIPDDIADLFDAVAGNGGVEGDDFDGTDVPIE